MRLQVAGQTFEALRACAEEHGLTLDDDHNTRTPWGNVHIALRAQRLTDLVRYVTTVTRRALQGENSEEFRKVLWFMDTAGTYTDGTGLWQVYYWPGLQRGDHTGESRVVS